MSDSHSVGARIRELSDEELLSLIDKPDDHTSEAVAIANDEVSRRGGREQLEVWLEEAVAEQRSGGPVSRRAAIVSAIVLVVSLSNLAFTIHEFGISAAPAGRMIAAVVSISFAGGVFFGSPFCLAGLILLLVLAAIEKMIVAFDEPTTMAIGSAVVHAALALLLSSTWHQYLRSAVARRGSGLSRSAVRRTPLV